MGPYPSSLKLFDSGHIPNRALPYQIIPLPDLNLYPTSLLKISFHLVPFENIKLNKKNKKHYTMTFFALLPVEKLRAYLSATLFGSYLASSPCISTNLVLGSFRPVLFRSYT